MPAARTWALVHGLSQLVIDGMLPGQDPEMLARAVLTSTAPTNALVPPPSP